MNTTVTIDIDESSVKQTILKAIKSINSFHGVREFSINWIGKNLGLLIYCYDIRRFICTFGSELYCGNLSTDRANISLYNITLNVVN